MPNVYNLKSMDDLEESEVIQTKQESEFKEPVYKSEFEQQLDITHEHYRNRVKKARSLQTLDSTRKCMWSLHNKLKGVEFSQAWVSRAMAQLDADGKNAKTKNNYSYAIQRFFIANGHHEINVPIFEFVNKEAKFHSLDEIKTIIGKSRKIPHRAILNFLYYMAPRVGELCNIRMDELDMTAQPPLVTIYATKTHKKRTIPIDDECLPSLKAWLKMREQIVNSAGINCPYLFFNQRGGQFDPKGIRVMVMRTSRAAGIRTHPHAFRHSRANHLLHIYHWDAATVAYFIGDTLEMLYSTYSHTGTSDAVRAMNAMRKKVRV